MSYKIMIKNCTSTTLYGCFSTQIFFNTSLCSALSLVYTVSSGALNSTPTNQPTLSVNMTVPAFAAKQYTCYQSISPACGVLHSKFTARCCRSDGRTDTRPFHTLCILSVDDCHVHVFQFHYRVALDFPSFKLTTS